MEVAPSLNNPNSKTICRHKLAKTLTKTMVKWIAITGIATESKILKEEVVTINLGIIIVANLSSAKVVLETISKP